MHEFVLGTGRQRSLRDVVRLCVRHIEDTEGVPRELTARTDTVRVVARRPEFAGEFDEFVITVRGSAKRISLLRETAQKLGTALCAVEEGEREITLRVPPEDASVSESALKAVDDLSAQMNLPEVWRVAGAQYRVDRISIELLFQAMVQYKASDVHLSPGKPPVFRVDNDTHQSELMGPLSAQQIRTLIQEIAPEEFWDEFLAQKQTSFNWLFFRFEPSS
jgi:hypothetical protein